MQRRQFIKRVIETTAIGSTSAFSAGKIVGANDRVNVGLIGCGGRGRLVAKLMREVPNVEIAAVCDVFDPQAAAAQERAGPGCRAYRGFRNSSPPEGLDWDFYLGPAPYVPYNKNRFLVTYRWFWDYAGGMATDYGTHRFDSVLQVMGADAPASVTASGGRYGLKDGAETPDVLQITYEFPTYVLSYEASMLNGHGCGGRTPGRKYYLTRGKDDRPHGMAFYRTNGALFADRVGFEIYPESLGESGPGAANSSAGPPEGYRMERKRSEEHTSEL